MKIITTIITVLLFCIMFVGNSNGQTADSSNSSNKSREKRETDKPLKIKNKPTVTYSPQDCSQSSGRISLRVTFDKSAKVTNIEIIESSNCERFDSNALKAAKKIKFSPAIKNGEPITVTKQVQYTFLIF